MDIALRVYLFIHGFAHLVGFLVAMRIMKDRDNPYKTTLLSGKVDVGDGGMKLMGIIWLLLALAFFLTGYVHIQDYAWWYPFAIIVSFASLVMCVLAWPDTRFGVLANLVLLAFLWLAPGMGWL